MSARVGIILAGGESRRMQSRRSKVLHEILGTPVLSYVVDAAAEAGVSSVIVVCNALNREPIEALLASAPIPCTTVIQGEARGTADAVACALPATTSEARTVVVLCGDAPLIRGASLARFLEQHEQTASRVSVLSGELEDPFGYGRILRTEGRFAEIVEERDASPEQRAVREINSGCLAFAAADLDALIARIPQAPNGELYLTRAIDLAAAHGDRVSAFCALAADEILGINTRAQLAKATAVLRGRYVESHMEQGVSFTDPGSAYIAKNVRIGRDTIVEPFVVIGSDCRIGEGCHLGPFLNLRGGCSVASGSRLGSFVECVRSELGEDSRVLHHAFLGDTQLGARVNVGAGCVFANWDGERHRAGQVGDDAFVGSGTIVVQPAGLAAGARTGAGAVVTHTVPSGETWAGIPARPLVREERQS